MHIYFNLLSTSYNLSTYAPRFHLFPIRYIYQLTHITSSLYTCLSLYENIRPYYLRSLTFAFLISRVSDDIARVFERKKNFLRISMIRRAHLFINPRGSQVRPRRSSRCDCRIRYTVAYYHQESVTRATCAARPSPRSSLWNGTKSNNIFSPWTARSAHCATRCSGLSTAWTTTRASITVGRNRSDRVRACLTCQGTPRNELNRHL